MGVGESSKSKSSIGDGFGMGMVATNRTRFKQGRVSWEIIHFFGNIEVASFVKFKAWFGAPYSGFGCGTFILVGVYHRVCCRLADVLRRMISQHSLLEHTSQLLSLLQPMRLQHLPCSRQLTNSLSQLLLPTTNLRRWYPLPTRKLSLNLNLSSLFWSLLSSKWPLYSFIIFQLSEPI